MTLTIHPAKSRRSATKTPPRLVAAAADRLDLLAARRDTVRYLDVPPAWFLMVDGTGAPAPDSLQPRIALLYPVAYGLHFALKRRGIVGRVPPLEGLWWLADERPLDAGQADRSDWRWTLLLPVPAETTESDIATVLAEVRGKRPDASWDDLRIESYAEGLSAQILHVGPYDEEGPTVERLLSAIAADGFRPRGRHHEIYLGDPRRARPERLRTIIRQPIERAA